MTSKANTQGKASRLLYIKVILKLYLDGTIIKILHLVSRLTHKVKD